MSDMRYVECCDQMVSAWAAMPYHYSDRQPVYLCKVGEGCSREEA
jgi:hypothetical protein